MHKIVYSMPMTQPHALYIFGPTASGKTGLAVEIANKINGVIINADSRQLYRGLPILSAVPTPDEQAAAEHRLYEFLDPTEPFSVGDYLKAATTQAKSIVAEGKTPIFVGGTGLYFDVLLHGISPIPPTPREVSLALSHRAETEGVATLYAELKRVDPVIAKQLHATDTQRICRALAVYQESGLPLSHWQAQPKQGALPYQAYKIALAPPRETVLQRQDARFDVMLNQGLLEEVETYLNTWSSIDPNALKTHGLRELTAHLKGDLTLAEAREEIITQMRQYSKRQMTWLRNTYHPDLILEKPDAATVLTALHSAFNI